MQQAYSFFQNIIERNEYFMTSLWQIQIFNNTTFSLWKCY